VCEHILLHNKKVWSTISLSSLPEKCFIFFKEFTFYLSSYKGIVKHLNYESNKMRFEIRMKILDEV
jgi:hypothetical protein